MSSADIQLNLAGCGDGEDPNEGKDVPEIDPSIPSDAEEEEEEQDEEQDSEDASSESELDVDDLMSRLTLSEAKTQCQAMKTKAMKAVNDYKKLKKAIDTETKKVDKEKKEAERKEAKKAKALAKKETMDEEITITINFGDRTFTITTRRSATIGSLRLQIVNALADLKQKDKTKLIIYHNDKAIHEINPRATLNTAGLNDGSVLRVSLPIQGGASFRVKKHLTKDEGILRLKEKSRQFVANNSTIDFDFVFFNEDEDTLPDNIKDFLKTNREVIDNIKVLNSQNLPVVKIALKQTDTDKLKEILRVLEVRTKNRGSETEGKILKCLDLLFPKMLVIEKATKTMAMLHKSMASFFLELYAGFYCEEHGNEWRFNNGAFLKDVMTEIEKREGHSLGDVPEAPNGCVLN